MSQLPEQILNQASAYPGLMGQGINLMNQPPFPAQMPGAIPQPSNIPVNMQSEDQKNQESKKYYFIIHIYIYFFKLFL